MNTFLPYRDFRKSSEVIDDRRLWKQVLEADGIIRIIYGERTKGYIHHPCVLMWKEYPEALTYYRNVMVNEWTHRRLYNTSFYFEGLEDPFHFKQPPWLGDEKFHSSHRAALLKKNYQWYSQFGWKEEPEINYYWLAGK